MFIHFLTFLLYVRPINFVILVIFDDFQGPKLKFNKLHFNESI